MTSLRIDFHFHLAWREQLLPFPAQFCDSFDTPDERPDWSALLADPAILDGYLESEGLDYAVGLPELSPLATGETTNAFCYETYAACERLILFASFNPHIDRHMHEQVHQWADRGFKGVKLYPSYHHYWPNDQRMYRFYEACLERDWPVMVHTGSSLFKGTKVKYADPVLLDEVAVDFPELKILVVHGGRGLWYQQSEALVKLHDNMYLEVSGLPPQNLLNYFPQLPRYGHKVIFGSDWPGMPGIRSNMEKIQALGLPDEMTDAILGGTAAKLLGLKAED